MTPQMSKLNQLFPSDLKVKKIPNTKILTSTAILTIVLDMKNINRIKCLSLVVSLPILLIHPTHTLWGQNGTRLPAKTLESEALNNPHKLDTKKADPRKKMIDDFLIGPSSGKEKKDGEKASEIIDGESSIKVLSKNLRRVYAIFEIEYKKKIIGKIKARLFHRRAPVTVENFVGLAEGTRQFVPLKGKDMVMRPYFDGLQFYKIVRNFMIVSGDPLNSGTGGPGYSIADEIHPDLKHSKPGILSMLNRGKSNTAGSQFFITLRKSNNLDKKYTIFGEVVSGMSIVKAISRVRTNLEDKPTRPVTIKSLTIEREFFTKQKLKAKSSKNSNW